MAVPYYAGRIGPLFDVSALREGESQLFTVRQAAPAAKAFTLAHLCEQAAVHSQQARRSRARCCAAGGDAGHQALDLTSSALTAGRPRAAQTLASSDDAIRATCAVMVTYKHGGCAYAILASRAHFEAQAALPAPVSSGDPIGAQQCSCGGAGCTGDRARSVSLPRPAPSTCARAERRP